MNNSISKRQKKRKMYRTAQRKQRAIKPIVCLINMMLVKKLQGCPIQA